MPTVEQADRDEAAAARDWALNVKASNDYLHNIRTIAGLSEIKKKQAGFAGSIVSSYQRNLQRDAERKAAADAKAARLASAEANGGNTHQGTIGDTLTVSGKLVFSRQCHGRYGTSYLYKFDTPAGMVIWFASRDQDLATGDDVTVTGKVKKHDSYKGERQTVLTRCRVS
jgi:hypothetical protein